MAVAEVVVVAEVAVTNMFCSNHSRLLLQFHITGRCNLRCKHCYREEGDVEPLSYEDVVTVVEQFKALRKEYNTRHHMKKRGHINLTGGEPFIHKDIKKILRYMGENKDSFSYGILSNGSFIDEELVALLKNTEVSFVQLSIDGNRETHDSLRAPGDYDRVLQTAEDLERHGIKTYISFTANRENYKYLPTVARECRKRHIAKLWSDRLVPIGNGQDLEKLSITRKELPSYIRTLKKAQGNLIVRKLYPKTQVTMNRALQFQKSKGAIYSCSAGSSLITVDEFGNVMPCRRMPIVCGNVLENSLAEVYWQNDVFQELRKERVPKECVLCKYAYLCKGGARCQSYARYHNYNKADPGCPLTR